MYIDAKGRARFWAKVHKTSNCWIWTASRVHDGYGRFKMYKKTRRAHRISWLLHHGPIPAGLCVLHTCDNPPCVNPDHLWLGTLGENIADMDKKGRRHDNRGEAAAASKLTAPEVINIRSRYEVGDISQAQLSRNCGVAVQTINNIVHRNTWQNI